MIKLFFSKRGSGKSKELINLANTESKNIKGHSVYIDNNKKRILSLDPRVRLVAMSDYDVTSYNEFSAFICGILSNDYDIENVYIDNFTKIVKSFDSSSLAEYLAKLESLSNKYNVNVYISAHDEGEGVRESIKEYLAV